MKKKKVLNATKELALRHSILDTHAGRKVKNKSRKIKSKLRIYRLNFHIRQWGMLESYKPLTINLVIYYLAQIRYLFTRSPNRAKIYIENTMSFTKEQIIPLLKDMPPNVKFIWGKRKKKVK